MIFDQLVLHNFGQYRGRHFVDLAPPSRDRPVVLFGALNGGGKTTLLDALQLALFGRFARCSNRGDLAYDEFLRRCINRDVDPAEGAAVELRFRHAHEGAEHTYRVHRSWSARDRSVRETVEVTCDNELDPVLTDEWAEQVEQFLPVRLSQFFFFDGEKIEALADLDRSSEALATAVRSLLGLDLVEQLATDLVVLERRKRSEHRDATDQAAVAELEAEVTRLEHARGRLVEERASAQGMFDVAEKRLRTAEERFRQGGGESFAKRAQIQSQRDAVEAQLAKQDSALEDEGGGSAPLLLVGDLLTELANQAQAERDAENAAMVTELLARRDEETLAALGRSGAAKPVVSALKRFLLDDRKARLRGAPTRPVLGLGREAQADLAGLRSSGPDLLHRLRRMVSERDGMARELDKLDGQLASVPEAETVARLAVARDDAIGAVAAARQALGAIDERLAEVTREHQGKHLALDRLHDRFADERFRQGEAERVLTSSGRVREVLGRFRTAVTERHVRRLEGLILEGFQHLVRKSNLLSGLRIEPDTFRVHLLGEGGAEMSPDRLSAGERQLLAVSIIWGLARASGRPIPVVIDTPLGRLDSQHRAHMVERYFPLAAPQVLVLSTDEEIDVELHAKLRRTIGRQYRLDYDEKARSTRIEKGYFW